MSKDTIYREDAIEAIHSYWKGELSKMPTTGSEYGEVIDGDCDTLLKHNKELSTRIKDIPSADRPQGWIPCRERLPEDDELMLVTYIDHREEAMPIWIGWHEMENVWYIDGDAHCEEIGNEVIAWMPLPEPWKGADDERP